MVSTAGAVLPSSDRTLAQATVSLGANPRLATGSAGGRRSEGRRVTRPSSYVSAPGLKWCLSAEHAEVVVRDTVTTPLAFDRGVARAAIITMFVASACTVAGATGPC